jgi:hypothetical protein
MKIEIYSKPLENNYIFLERGKRSLLHPKLKVIDFYDCSIMYYIHEKIFVVDYKSIGGTYTKTLLTSTIDDIVSTLSEDS